MAAAPFYYANTDKEPAEGAPGYMLTPDNVAPALALWMLMTTNPQWVTMFMNGKIDAALGDLQHIADAVGLTAVSTQWIFNLVGDKSSETAKAFHLVANTFQTFKDTASDSTSYHPPFCPSTLDEIMNLKPKARATNSVANMVKVTS